MKSLIITTGLAFVALIVVAILYVIKNRPRPEKVKKDKIRIACIGDSITYGAGVLKSRKKDAWAYVLNEKLGMDYQVINYGFSGTTLQREGDLPYRRFHFLEKAKNAEPAVILLMLGTNDSKPYNWDKTRYKKQYEEMVLELLDNSWRHKLVLLVPPKAFPSEATGKVAFDITNETIFGDIRPTIFSVGEKYGLQVVDLYTLTDGHPEYFEDGVHPNVLGNKTIAEYVYDTISVW